MSQNTYKIVFIGDGGVGKSTFLKRHKTGAFEKKYISTIGVEVHPITFDTNYGKITFNVWDCAGQEKFGGLRAGYYLKAQAAVAFFDVTNHASFNNIDSWIYSFVKVEPESHVVICGNKCDEKDRKVMPNDIRKKICGDDIYYEISAKTNYNFDKPFLKLARLLTGHKDLNFITSDPIKPNIVLNVEPNSKIAEELPCVNFEDKYQNKYKNDTTLELLKLIKQIDENLEDIYAERNDRIKILNSIMENDLELKKIKFVEEQNLFQKSLIIHEICERKKLAEKSVNNDANSNKNCVFNNHLIKAIKLGVPKYMEVATEVWTLSKEEFIQKHKVSLPSAYIDALVSLYDKSKAEREKILIENEIFC